MTSSIFKPATESLSHVKSPSHFKSFSGKAQCLLKGLPDQVRPTEHILVNPCHRTPPNHWGDPLITVPVHAHTQRDGWESWGPAQKSTYPMLFYSFCILIEVFRPQIFNVTIYAVRFRSTILLLVYCLSPLLFVILFPSACFLKIRVFFSILFQLASAVYLIFQRLLYGL